MPIYEYACGACGHEFEEWQKMSDPPVRTCPKCKKKKVEKLISHTAFQLKGGGWYADLYASSKPGAKDGGGGDKAESKSDKSTEGKAKEAPSAPASSEAKGAGKAKESAKSPAKKAEPRAA